jgi:uncharacterized damage-inducible protein DinB
MDRRAIQELFDYTGWAWERIEKRVDSLPDTDYVRPIEGSGWPSLAACLMHVVATYDGWLNGSWGRVLSQPICSWGELKAYRGRVREAFTAQLAVPDRVLLAKRTSDTDDPEEMMSPAEVLTNLALHERGHHGDLNTLFHQLGVRSFHVDYTLFITRPAEFVLDEG